MTWTFMTIIAIGVTASLAMFGVRLGLIERRPVTYTEKERLAWSITFAAIPLIVNGDWSFIAIAGCILHFARKLKY